MKKINLLFALVLLSSFNSQAGVSINLGLGYGNLNYHDRYSTHHDYYCYRQFQSYPYYYIPPPAVYTEQPPCSQPLQQQIPYGFIVNGNLKSPYSDFTVQIGGHSSGEVFYDSYNGKPFKLP